MVRKQLPRGETSIPRGVVCFVCLKRSLLMQKYLDRVYVYMIRPYSSIKKTGRTISSRTRNLIYCIAKFNHLATDLEQPISEPYFCVINGLVYIWTHKKLIIFSLYWTHKKLIGNDYI
ncbi:unnamed protein product [Rhizophagus irregularis]|nr:unnamed protein product [Rhizophagus irregularis]